MLLCSPMRHNRLYLRMLCVNVTYAASPVSWIYRNSKQQLVQTQKFHAYRCNQIKSSLWTMKYDDNDDEEEQIHYTLVKAPPGVSDTTVPGKVEWVKTIGTNVAAGELVCRIRFKDGRAMDIQAPVKGVIATRGKNEAESVEHGDELFKIRTGLVSSSNYISKKKLMKKQTIEFDEDDSMYEAPAELEVPKAQGKSSYITTYPEPELYDMSKPYKALGPLSTESKETSRGLSLLSSSSITNIKSTLANLSHPSSGNQRNDSGDKSSLPPLRFMTMMDEINMESTVNFMSNYDKFNFPAKPSYRSLYLKAAEFVLKMNPNLNIRVLGNEKIQKTSIDITTCIRSSKVMIFNTFRNIEGMSYMDIVRRVQEIKNQIAQGTFKQDTKNFDFTIGQEWEIGSVFSTPFYSKTCTLGLHKMLTRPLVVGNKIAAYPMMYISLTYDNIHIADEDAIKFLQMYKSVIEEPRYILLNT